MRYLLNAKEMKSIDGFTIEKLGVPSIVLMERAALCVLEEAENFMADGSRILILCGTGNNGGDGLALARMLYLKRYEVEVLITSDPSLGSVDFKEEYKIIQNLNIRTGTIQDFTEYIRKSHYHLLIDAMFGTGLSRPISGDIFDLIKTVNESDIPAIAVDIPSGIKADDGSVLGIAVKADITVTFGYEKIGHILYPGSSYCGKVIRKDIGLGSLLTAGIKPKCYTYGESDLSRLPRRIPYSHKGTYGKLLVIAGSKDMGGAAILSTKAALRTGVGMVRTLTAKENRSPLLTAVPEAIVSTFDADNFSVENLAEACRWADAIVAGPGMGKHSYVKTILNYILQYGGTPIVLDADALNVISENPEMTSAYRSDIIVTPHVGEMARLSGIPAEDVTGTRNGHSANIMEAALSYSEIHKVVCVLKDTRTIVAEPRGSIYINTSGNNGMATAGSGDVLSGVIGGLLVSGMAPKMAATLGVYLHGKAGDEAVKRTGLYSLTASDITEGIMTVTSQVSTYE